jgi:hypothetical protein
MALIAPRPDKSVGFACTKDGADHATSPMQSNKTLLREAVTRR